MTSPRLRLRRKASIAQRLDAGADDAVREALKADPIGTCMVGSVYERAGMAPERLGGAFWGVDRGRGALLYAGANMVMVRGRGVDLDPLARVWGTLGCQCASITGRAGSVLDMWERLSLEWPAAREVRADQPLLVCPKPARPPSDPQVEVVGPERINDYLPAAVAMFREEVGVDPTAGDGGRGYRARVLALLRAGRAFARFDGSTVVFKAEIGAQSRGVALIQGVWVHPAWRGNGLAVPAMSAVVEAVQRSGTLPSLYVNAHNLPARATYRRVGFHQEGTFATVLF